MTVQQSGVVKQSWLWLSVSVTMFDMYLKIALCETPSCYSWTPLRCCDEGKISVAKL